MNFKTNENNALSLIWKRSFFLNHKLSIHVYNKRVNEGCLIGPAPGQRTERKRGRLHFLIWLDGVFARIRLNKHADYIASDICKYNDVLLMLNAMRSPAPMLFDSMVILFENLLLFKKVQLHLKSNARYLITAQFPLDVN